MIDKLEELISFSNHLADESEIIIKKYFRQKMNVESKSDQSPVTIADKNVELKIRELIEEKYPSHGILGEEFDDKKKDSEFLWVIDPIDGTRSFIAGHKDFGTLIALVYNDIPIIGIINCPMHNERWLGVINHKTTLNGNVVTTSKITSVSKSYFCTTGLYLENEHFKKSCDKIINKAKYYRLGGDCYMYAMIASGLIEIVLEDTLKTHDYMALIPIIEGAGGVVSDKHGKSLNINSKSENFKSFFLSNRSS